MCNCSRCNSDITIYIGRNPWYPFLSGPSNGTDWLCGSCSGTGDCIPIMNNCTITSGMQTSSTVVYDGTQFTPLGVLTSQNLNATIAAICEEITSILLGIPTFQCSQLNTCSIDSLADVDTTTVAPQTGDILQWNGTKWVPDTQSIRTIEVKVTSGQITTFVGNVNSGGFTLISAPGASNKMLNIINIKKFQDLGFTGTTGAFYRVGSGTVVATGLLNQSSTNGYQPGIIGSGGFAVSQLNQPLTIDNNGGGMTIPGSPPQSVIFLITYNILTVS